MVLDEVRARKREAGRGVLIDDVDRCAGSATAMDRSTRDPAAAIDLERAVVALPAGARRAFILHHVEGYKQEEIASLSGVAVGTVKSQLHRARRLLREALEPDREEGRS